MCSISSSALRFKMHWKNIFIFTASAVLSLAASFSQAEVDPVSLDVNDSASVAGEVAGIPYATAVSLGLVGAFVVTLSRGSSGTTGTTGTTGSTATSATTGTN